MLILMIIILLIFMTVNFLMIISNIISKKTFQDQEKTPLLNVDLTLKIQDFYLFPFNFSLLLSYFQFLM